jgi:hypothetical protein
MHYRILRTNMNQAWVPITSKLVFFQGNQIPWNNLIPYWSSNLFVDIYSYITPDVKPSAHINIRRKPNKKAQRPEKLHSCIYQVNKKVTHMNKEKSINKEQHLQLFSNF